MHVFTKNIWLEEFNILLLLTSYHPLNVDEQNKLYIVFSVDSAYGSM